jgi:hypothetical protein
MRNVMIGAVSKEKLYMVGKVGYPSRTAIMAKSKKEAIKKYKSIFESIYGKATRTKFVVD